MFKNLLITSALLLSGAAIVSANTQYYTGASALAGKSGDFATFGGAAHVGYRVTEKVGAEFEAGFLHGSDKKTFEELDAGIVTLIDAKAKVKMNRVPLMINARFMDSMGSFNYYVGAGIGAEILHATYTIAGIDGKDTHSQVKFSGQVFAGVGYAFTEQLSAGLGARCLMSQKLHFKGFKTSAFTPMAEVSLNYAF